MTRPKITQTEVVMNTKKYGHWSVLKEDVSKKRYVLCKCSCGVTKSIRVDSLVKGDSTSCGCRPDIFYGKKFKTKTLKAHPLYRIWQDMNRRCYNENRNDFKYYGGRGIEVCSEWKGGSEGFKTFLKDMEGNFSIGLEIERLDVNGNYCKNNCCWIPRRSQINNTRVNKVIKYKGVSLSLAEWAYLIRIDVSDLSDRLSKTGETLEDIISKGVKFKRYFLLHNGEIKTLKDIREQEGISYYYQRESRLKFGNTVDGLRSLGINVEEVKVREKDHLSFEEGLKELRDKKRDCFEDHLLFKIETQLEER